MSRSEAFAMPAGWTKSTDKNGKTCFINSKKEISYVDPRDEFWKKKSWSEIPADSDETPYGWERVEDEILGVYFIDHLNGRNVFGDPRTEAEDQTQIREKLNEELEILRAQKAALEKEIQSKSAEIGEEEEKLRKKEKKHKEEEKERKEPKTKEEKDKLKEKEKKRKKKKKKKVKEIDEKKVELDLKEHEKDTLIKQISDLENLTKSYIVKREEEVEKQKQMQVEITKLKDRLKVEIELTEKAFQELESLRELFEAKVAEKNLANSKSPEIQDLEQERERLEKERKTAEETEKRQEMLRNWEAQRKKELEKQQEIIRQKEKELEEMSKPKAEPEKSSKSKSSKEKDSSSSSPSTSAPSTPSTPSAKTPTSKDFVSSSKDKDSKGAKYTRDPKVVGPEEGPDPLDKAALLRSDLERRMELVRLQRQIEQAEEERKIIEKLKAKMMVEKVLLDKEDQDGEDKEAEDYKKIPDWVKQINSQATFTKTLRIKLKSNPDVLSFKQKAFLFTGKN